MIFLLYVWVLLQSILILKEREKILYHYAPFPDASLIYDKMRALIKSNKKHNIVIVGGGATGVSLGGALSDFVKESKKSDILSITIIEALPTILSGWDERLVKKVNEVLLEKGIRIMTNSAVTRVENDGDGSVVFILVIADQKSIHLLLFGLQGLKAMIYQ